MTTKRDNFALGNLGAALMHSTNTFMTDVATINLRAQAMYKEYGLRWDNAPTNVDHVQKLHSFELRLPYVEAANRLARVLDHLYPRSTGRFGRPFRM